MTSHKTNGLHGVMAPFNMNLSINSMKNDCSRGPFVAKSAKKTTNKVTARAIRH